MSKKLLRRNQRGGGFAGGSGGGLNDGESGAPAPSSSSSSSSSSPLHPANAASAIKRVFKQTKETPAHYDPFAEEPHHVPPPLPTSAGMTRTSSVTDKNLPCPEGNLFQLTTLGLIKSWKKRYAVARRGKLSFYASKMESAHLGSLDLAHVKDITVRQAPPFGKQPHCFDIVTEKEVVHFAAESKEIMDDWVSALKVLKTHWAKQLAAKRRPARGVVKNKNPDDMDDFDIDDEPDFSALVFRDHEGDGSSEHDRESWFDALEVIWDLDVEFRTRIFPEPFVVYQDDIRFQTATIQNGTPIEEVMSSLREEFELADISQYRLIKVNHLGEVSVINKPRTPVEKKNVMDHFFILQPSKMVFVIFFDESTFEIVISGPDLTAGDICSHKHLVSRLEDPTEANLYERFPNKKEVSFDLEKVLIFDPEQPRASKIFLRCPTSGLNDRSLGEETRQRGSISSLGMDLEGPLSYHRNSERKNRFVESKDLLDDGDHEDPGAQSKGVVDEEPVGNRPQVEVSSPVFAKAPSISSVSDSPVEERFPESKPPIVIEKLQGFKKFPEEMIKDSRSMNFGRNDEDPDGDDGGPVENPPAAAQMPEKEESPEDISPPLLQPSVLLDQPNDLTQPRLAKKANPSRLLGKTAPLAISSPALLRVTLTKAAAKRESMAVKQISLSGVELCLQDGVWVLRDEALEQTISSICDAPGTQEGVKYEDVPLAGMFIARYLVEEKRWMVCLRNNPDANSLGTRLESEVPVDTLQQLLDGANSGMQDAPLDSSTVWGSTSQPLFEDDDTPKEETRRIWNTESKGSRQERLLGCLDNLKKTVDSILEWLEPENDDEEGDEGEGDLGEEADEHEEFSHDINFLVRGKFGNALAQLLLLGFKERSSLPFFRNRGSKVTLWDLVKTSIPETESTWLNAISTLDNDPVMGKDPDMKFRSFICVLLNTQQLAHWFEVMLRNKDQLLSFYGDFFLFNETLACQEIARVLSSLTPMAFNLSLFYEVDILESKAQEDPQTVTKITETAKEALGKLKSKGSSLVLNLKDTMKRTASNFDDLGSLRTRSSTSLSYLPQDTDPQANPEGEDSLDPLPEEVVATGIITKAIPSSETKPPDVISTTKIANQLKTETKNFVRALSDLTAPTLTSVSHFSTPPPVAEVDVTFTATFKKVPGQSLGMALTAQPPDIIISGITSGTIAAEGGVLRPGDKILKINDKSTAGWTLQQVVEALREAEETVSLLILSKRRVEQQPAAAPHQEPPEPESPTKLESVGKMSALLKNAGDAAPATPKKEAPPATGESTATPPKTFVCQSVEVTKTHTGFGMDLIVGEKGVLVKSLASSGAAYLTGRIQAGDMIVEINGKSIVGWPQEQVVALLKGSATVRLLIIPKNQLH